MKVLFPIVASILLCGCQKGAASIPSPPPKPAVAAPVAPEEKPLKRLSIDGWLDLKWEESAELAQAQLKKLLPNSFHCKREKWEAEKGVKRDYIGCENWKDQPDHKASVSAIFLDGKLGRVIVAYNFRPDEASLLNLEKALTERYCPLRESLNQLVQQARSGNVGQASIADFECNTSSQLFLRITNGADSSRVSVHLSSPKFIAFLTENEHKGSF